MAVDPYPSKRNDPAWDDFTSAHADPAIAPGSLPASLDVDRVTELLRASQQISAAREADDGSRVPLWAKGETAKTLAWAAVPTSFLSIAANVAYAQSATDTLMVGGIATALATVLGLAAVAKNWNTSFMGGALVVAAHGIAFETAAGSGGWMELVAWLTGFGAALGAKIMWNRNHAKSRAEERLIDARTEHERAKTYVTRNVGEARIAVERLRLQQMAAVERPYLDGTTSEEASIRSAVWRVFEKQLLTCDVTPTRTGWTAVVALPTGLSQREARASWDKVASAMKLDGRMKCADGSRTNELNISFVDNALTGGASVTGWHPGASWAVVADTGDAVPVPLGRRILFAGTSGSGKSWSARPLMAEASEYPDHRLILIDMKHTEARNWGHRARIATEADQIEAVTNELIHEGERRLKLIPRGRDVVEISAEMPRLTVFVDEGGELLSALEEEIIERLRTIARKYRAAEIILVWCTQKPTLTGNGHGLDSQISAQLTHKLSLAVATPSESRVVFGEDAGDKGWDAHELPMPGWALLRDIETQSAPERLRMRAMSPADVIGLDDRPVWTVSGDRHYSGDEQYQELSGWTLAAAETVGQSDLDKVRAFRAANPDASKRAVAAATGVPEGSVQRHLKALAEEL